MSLPVFSYVKNIFLNRCYVFLRIIFFPFNPIRAEFLPILESPLSFLFFSIHIFYIKKGWRGVYILSRDRLQNPIR